MELLSGDSGGTSVLVLPFVRDLQEWFSFGRGRLRARRPGDFLSPSSSSRSFGRGLAAGLSLQLVLEGLLLGSRKGVASFEHRPYHWIRSFTGAGSAWIVWALANAVWILGELEFPGVNGFNFASASLLFVALILLICGYASYKEAEQKVLCNETSGDESSASGSIQLSCMSSQSSAC